MKLRNMPCSKDPGSAIANSPIAFAIVLPSTRVRVSATPIIRISRLNHFDLSAYGLFLLLPTLNPCRYLHVPKAVFRMCWAALS